MPLLILLIASIAGGAFFLSFLQVLQGTGELSRATEESAAAFYAAESQSNKLEFNQGIPVSAEPPRQNSNPETFPQTWFLPSAELFLYRVSPKDAVDAIRLDYCFRESISPCPELLIEWFSLQPNFRFFTLSELKNRSKALQAPFDNCLFFSAIGIKRCAIRTDAPLGISGSSDFSIVEAEPPFSNTIRLRTLFSNGQHYLFRIRSLDRSSFPFRLSGERAGEIVALPMIFSETDSEASAGRSARKIRKFRLPSAGLQDGLDFVHAAEEVENK